MTAARSLPGVAAACPAPLDTEEAALLLLKGLGCLVAQADRPDLHPAAAILNTAREDLAGWVADCVEQRAIAKADRMLATPYQQLLATGLFPAAGVALKIAAITDLRVKQEVATVLGLRC